MGSAFSATRFPVKKSQTSAFGSSASINAIAFAVSMTLPPPTAITAAGASPRKASAVSLTNESLGLGCTPPFSKTSSPASVSEAVTSPRRPERLAEPPP